MYGNVVLQIDKREFDEIFDHIKEKANAKLDTDMPASSLQELVKQYKALVKAKTKADFPEDPRQQLQGAINAVFGSWRNPRAIHYRRMNKQQTGNGKRTGKAPVKIAADMVNEGLITPEEAVMRVEPLQLDQLLHPILDPKAKVKELAQGLPASPGAVSGRIVFSAEDAVEKVKEGRVVLVRKETVPDDIHGM